MIVTSQKSKLESVHIKSIEEELSILAASWEEANVVLQQWAIATLKDGFVGDIEEVKITIKFEQLKPYQFRIDLTHGHFAGVNLAAELMKELEFMGGDRPCHMTPQQYSEYLRKWEINTNEYKSLILAWDIPA
jgi:hypothetical protein